MTQMPPPSGQPMGAAMRPHRGTLLLVLGIVSLVCCQILGIVPWIMGNGDLKEMDAGRMDPEGRGLTQAGKILGIVAVCLLVISVVLQIILLALGMGMMFVVPGAGGSGTGP